MIGVPHAFTYHMQLVCGAIMVHVRKKQERRFLQCTVVRFASPLSGGFTTMAVINPPEKKLANCTSVH